MIITPKSLYQWAKDKGLEHNPIVIQADKGAALSIDGLRMVEYKAGSEAAQCVTFAVSDPQGKLF